MDEFQTNASLLRNSRYYYNLPPSFAMPPMQEEGKTYIIWFVLASGDRPPIPSHVRVSSRYNVDELKEAVKEKSSLNVPVTQIILWKLKRPIPITLDTAAETMTFNDELNSIQLPNPDLDDPPEGMLVQLRGVTADVCEIWEDTPQPKCLHLIAQEWSSSNEISLTTGSKQANSLPLSHTHRWSEASTLERLPLPSKQSKRPSVLSEDEGRERKRTRKLKSEIPEGLTTVQPLDGITNNLRELHRLFWGVSDSPFFVTNCVKIPDARSLRTGKVKKFETINLPHPIRFPDGSSTLIITEIFKMFREQLRRNDDAWEQVQGSNMPFADPSHSSVISGQPGIGKTVFLDDVLVHRLQAKLVTIFCNVRGYAHVFRDKGVRRISLNDEDRIPELDDNPRSCALVNLGAQLLQPPEQFYPSHRLGRLVVAASPNLEHVSCFQERPALTYYMPTWDWDDLYCGSLVHVGKVSSHIQAEHNKRLRDAYWKFAGIPRICYKVFSDSAMAEHLGRVKTALANIKSVDDFARAMEGLLAFKQEASHNLIKVEPIPDTNWKEFRSELKSAFISGLVFEQIQLHQMNKLSEEISHLLLNSDTRRHAGRLFESAAHRAFEKGMKIEPTAITPNAPCLVLDIQKANPDIAGRFYTLSVRAAPRSQNAHKRYFGQYLLPISKTQESVDAVVITAYFTVFLQMTVTTRHGIKLNGILDLLKELPANAKKNLRIVFVLPSDDKETRSFGHQKIISPQGASDKDIAQVTSIPQYVYRLPLKTFNKL